MPLEFDRPLVLVGAGNMGGALLMGWLERGLDPANTIVLDPSPAPAIAKLIVEKGIVLNPPVEDVAARSPGFVVLAVKPQGLDEVAAGLAPLAGAEPVFLSVAAGKTVASMAKHFGRKAAIIRSIPNTPAAIGRGITAAFANDSVSAEQKVLATALLEAVGEVGWVEQEDLIDAATAVSGSGPAYVFYLVECLAAAGEAVGLAPDLAMRLARATVSGAGELIHRSEEAPDALRQKVTSPGGTTAAALEVLMAKEGLPLIIERAVRAARNRAHELSG